ncbi:hypothetical protein Salat_1432200 [Sesamum alatum]|uniref:Uncharacterized protein n=1 Tax=Sesamum alatum TaxID=300844 RepID=A0AAE2CLJ5_9LAMI|nr:hypothetical protein Salat_1432200 [Sesamum alatum]
MDNQNLEPTNQMSKESNDNGRKKGKRVMFSEDNQENTDRHKGSRPETLSKEMLRINDTVVSPAKDFNQNASHETEEVSDEDKFNYDDPIIAELLDRDWDKEFNKHGKSHNDKVAHFDNASTKNGTSGGTKRDQEPAHASNSFKQLSFIPAWSLEEGESDIMETHMEGSRILYKGDTSTHRNTDSQETEAASEEEEESTPIFNRFQSLQNLGEEEPQITDQLNQPHTKDITEA